MSSSRRPFWAGRTLALAAILLTALNLRSAVAALSPIVAFIAEDVPLDALAIGVLGMLAPVAFASCGVFAPALSRRFGVEATLVGACVVMMAGPVLRASAGSAAVLFAGTALTFLGMGVGNVLLPPAVKRYFPDRIGMLTAAYATLLAVSTMIPPAFAVPLAEATSWRVSLAVWALFALCAVVPWAVLWLRARRTAGEAEAAGPDRGRTGDVKPRTVSAGRLRSSPIAWAMVAAFGGSGVHVYTMFAWLPQLLIEHAGLSAAAAGAMLAVYALIGLPLSLAVPVLAARMRSVAPLIYVGAACFVSGYLGLLLLPTTATLLWVVLAGAGPLIFPVTLVLINTRSRTPAGSVALSGFTQSFGYTAAAAGPLVVGLLQASTGGWTAPLVFLVAAAVLPGLAGFVLRKPGYADDPRG